MHERGHNLKLDIRDYAIKPECNINVVRRKIQCTDINGRSFAAKNDTFTANLNVLDSSRLHIPQNINVA